MGPTGQKAKEEEERPEREREPTVSCRASPFKFKLK